MTKYNEVMERVTVTPEARERILSAVSEGKRATKVLSFRRWLPLAAAACLALVIGVVWRGGIPTAPGADATPNGYDLQNVYDEVVCADAQELAEASGLPVRDFEMPFTVREASYSFLWGELAQISYNGENGESATYRVVAGTEDNSGDYSDYADVRDEVTSVGTVTLKGADGRYSLAVWTDGEYAYSLSLPPQPLETWLAMLNG